MAVPSSSVCPGLSASSLWSGPWLYHPHLYVQVCRRPVYDQVHGCTIHICMSRSVGVQFMIRSMAVPSSSVCPGLSASSLWSGPWLYHPHLYVQVCQRPVYDQVHGYTILICMSRSVSVQFMIRSMAVPSSSVCPGLSASSLWSGPWLYHPHLYAQVCRHPVYNQVHGCTILICMSRSVGVQFMIRSMAVPSSSVCPGLSASSLWSGPWLYHPHLYAQVCRRPVYDQVHGCTILICMSRSVSVQFMIRSMAVPSSSVCPGLSASSLWSGPWLYHPHLYVQVCQRPVYDQVHGCTILICMSRSVSVQFMIRSMAVPSSSVCPGLSASSLWSGPWLYHPHLYVQVCQRPVYDQVHGCTILICMSRSVSVQFMIRSMAVPSSSVCPGLSASSL